MPLIAYQIKTLLSCLILGELGTFANYDVWVTSCVISCECMCMILCVCVRDLWHGFNCRISNTCALGTQI
jgi:hypothetical protein